MRVEAHTCLGPSGDALAALACPRCPRTTGERHRRGEVQIAGQQQQLLGQAQNQMGPIPQWLDKVLFDDTPTPEGKLRLNKVLQYRWRHGIPVRRASLHHCVLQGHLAFRNVSSERQFGVMVGAVAIGDGRAVDE